MTLHDILNQIDNETPDTVISDGANDWDAHNLLGALDEVELSREAVLSDNGIILLKEDGYQETPAAYTLRDS